ncbi:hypothetical protein ID858_07955 [Xenorhabdus sp. DI]|uniref:hypothetical protein n=1 Tax=Xenorhabdus doucetiae TaxID=351671 RepID=UPI00199C061F|nr:MULTISPECIES: hypothetical protein [unclassified Xenorhabdus]MBD2785417.1 hypothetical protein [Xenorhabdus sp. 3]MBD2788441.1 hypothetical protein [Xenorhabdus sp. DI]
MLIKDDATLRDYFAGLAMQGLLSNPAMEYDFDGLARDAYRIADEMLKDKENNNG